MIRVTIERKQDKVTGNFHILIAPGKNGKWKVIDQDPIAGWRCSSKRGMLAINVWKNWARFHIHDYRTIVSFTHDGSMPNNIDYNDIFPPRPIPVWSNRKRVTNVR